MINQLQQDKHIQGGLLYLQVIIVPIFWNKKADEKVTVLAAAEEVQQQLQELGLAVGLDSTNADTPGQKYRYWSALPIACYTMF